MCNYFILFVTVGERNSTGKAYELPYSKMTASRLVITTAVDGNVNVNMRAVNGTPSQKDVIVSQTAAQQVFIITRYIIV